MTRKSDTIKLNASTLKPISDPETIEVFNGTEAGHFYVPFAKVEGINICARRLDQDVSTVQPKDGQVSRVRIIGPNANYLSNKQVEFLLSLGITLKNGSGNAHYSGVTSRPSSLIDAVVAGLAYLS